MTRCKVKLHCYCVPPIDCFDGMQTLETLLFHNPGVKESALVYMLDRAKEIFLALGWEGDVVDGPYFFAVPQAHEVALGCCIKQAHAGWTFIAAPHEMPWLDDEREGYMWGDLFPLTPP